MRRKKSKEKINDEIENTIDVEEEVINDEEIEEIEEVEDNEEIIDEDDDEIIDDEEIEEEDDDEDEEIEEDEKLNTSREIDFSNKDELFFEKMSGIHITKEKNPETENLLSLLEFKYPNISDTKLPSKITVTELKKRKEQDILLDGIEVFKRRNKIKEEKNTGLTSAQIGIAYHTIMQKYDITMPIEDKEDVKAQIEIIREKGFLTEEEAGAVNPEKILNLEAISIFEIASIIKKPLIFIIRGFFINEPKITSELFSSQLHPVSRQ